MLVQARPLLAAQPECQSLCHTLGDGVLHLEDVRETRVELICPDSSASLHVDKPNRHSYLITDLLYAPVQYELRLNFLPSLDGILLNVGVFAHGAYRSHDKLIDTAEF